MIVERLRDADAGVDADIDIDADIDAIIGLEADSFTHPWSREALVWELRNSDVTRVYLLRDDQRRILRSASAG